MTWNNTLFEKYLRKMTSSVWKEKNTQERIQSHSYDNLFCVPRQVLDLFFGKVPLFWDDNFILLAFFFF